MANETTKVITGKVRFSFCNVWVPKSINGGDEKYSVSLLISKEDNETLGKINAGIKEAEKAGIAKYGAKFTSGAGINSRNSLFAEFDEEIFNALVEKM